MTSESVLTAIDLYRLDLHVYAHHGLPRFYMPRSFHERVDSLLLLLCRQCPYLHTLVLQPGWANLAVSHRKLLPNIPLLSRLKINTFWLWEYFVSFTNNKFSLFLTCTLNATIHINVLSSLISFLNIKVRNDSTPKQSMGLYDTNSFLICGIDSSFVHSTWKFTVDLNIAVCF